jgi:hypothetical protein
VRNVLADPEPSVEVETEDRDHHGPVRAAQITGPRRTSSTRARLSGGPGFAEYKRTTDRAIPVIALEPTD